MRETDDGYPAAEPRAEGLGEDAARIDMKPGDAVRLRKTILKDALGSLTVSKGRTFKVELHAEREKLSDGDITLDIRDDADIDGLRQHPGLRTTKQPDLLGLQTADDTWEALTELHRSKEMIDRYDNASQTDAQRVLLAEERKRRDRAGRRPISSWPVTSRTAPPFSTAHLEEAPVR